jgi:hypothetical protein
MPLFTTLEAHRLGTVRAIKFLIIFRSGPDYALTFRLGTVLGQRVHLFVPLILQSLKSFHQLCIVACGEKTFKLLLSRERFTTTYSWAHTFFDFSPRDIVLKQVLNAFSVV